MQINFHPLWFTAGDTQNYLLDSVSHFPIIILIIMQVLLCNLYLYIANNIHIDVIQYDFDYLG